MSTWTYTTSPSSPLEYHWRSYIEQLEPDPQTGRQLGLDCTTPWGAHICFVDWKIDGALLVGVVEVGTGSLLLGNSHTMHAQGAIALASICAITLYVPTPIG